MLKESFPLKRPSLVTVVLIFMLAFSACSKDVSGTYVPKDGTPTPYLELKSDGTFYLQSVIGGGVSGKYKLEGMTLTLIPDIGIRTKGLFLDDGSLQMDGFTFIKKH